MIMMRYKFLKVFLLLIISFLLAKNSFSTKTENNINKSMIVIIDPGHGGKDPGAVSKGTREKDIVLGIGLKLGKLISDTFPDVKVIYTRNTDVFVPLIERSRIANKSKADLFISLHANFCATPATRGTETFVLGLHRSNDNLDVAKKENSVILLEDNYSSTYEDFDPNSSESYIMFELVQNIYMDQSVSFADAIQQQFKSKLETSNRGVKQAGFLVLRQSSMPSVLIETGFLSNQNEAKYLSSESGQETISLSIFDAFRKFKSWNSGTITPNLATVKAKSVEKDTNARTEIKQDTEPIANVIPAVEKPSKNEDTAANHKFEIKEKVEKPLEKSISNGSTSIGDKNSDNNNYYSVQIAASVTSVDPTPSNFKGLKGIKRDKTDKYYRYYFGNESSLEKIKPLQQQIKSKYPQAFIVSFVNGKRTVINTDTK